MCVCVCVRGGFEGGGSQKTKLVSKTYYSTFFMALGHSFLLDALQ